MAKKSESKQRLHAQRGMEILNTGLALQRTLNGNNTVITPNLFLMK